MRGRGQEGDHALRREVAQQDVGDGVVLVVELLPPCANVSASSPAVQHPRGNTARAGMTNVSSWFAYQHIKKKTSAENEEHQNERARTWRFRVQRPDARHPRIAESQDPHPPCR